MTKDHLTRARRSWNMSRIKGKNTAPELVVRSLLHRLGYRFRLHVRIPFEPPPNVTTKYAKYTKVKTGLQDGRRSPTRLKTRDTKLKTGRIRYVCPDIVLPKYKIAILCMAASGIGISLINLLISHSS